MIKKLLTAVLIFTFCLYSLSFSQSTPAIQWQNTIGGDTTDNLYSIQQTADGGYILGGWSSSNISGDKTENNMDTVCNPDCTFDYWIVKTDSLGNIQWQNTIGGSNHDVLYCIEQTADGGYILGGESISNISGDKFENCKGYDDYWIVKTDAAGNIQWQNTIGGSLDDHLSSIQQTADGGYILGGSSQSNISGDKTENSNGSYDYWIVKTNTAGNIQWQNTIGGSGFEMLNSIQQTADGGYILGGDSRSNISGDKTENNCDTICTPLCAHDYWIVKTDSLGNIQWQNTIGGSNYDHLQSIQQTADGGYILGGYSQSNISCDKTENSMGGLDYWIVKTDTAGNIQWQNTIGGSEGDELRSIQQTNNGGYILGGYSLSDISGDKMENCIGIWDYWIVKTDAMGNIQWQNTIGGSDYDQLYAIQQTNDGGYILGGSSRSNISGDKTENSNGSDDYWIVKIATDSVTGISPTAALPSEEGVAIAPNPATDKINISFPATGSENITIKIYSVTGEVVFESPLTPRGETEMEVPFGDLGAGIYFLSVQTGREVLTRKIVIQH